MKCYIAARFDKKDMVREIQRKLIDRGYEIIADWTTHRVIKPYEKNPDEAGIYATEDFDGARLCNLFILISDDAGTGMYTEFGGALASFMERGAPKIYVIGEHCARSMFFFHPAVKRRATIDEVLAEI